jgi:SAM-dependent methyltransferase
VAVDAEGWDERYAEAQVWSADPNRFVVEHVAGLAPGRALDLAAGEGRNAVWLAAQGWTVTAVDFSQVGLERGRAHGGDVEWVLADVTRWTPPARSFDLVVVCYLHLPGHERRAVLHAAAGAVDAGGRLLVVGHDRSNLTEGHGGPGDPEVLFDADDVTADLAATGLDVVEAGTRSREVDDAPRPAIDVVVLASRPGDTG